MPIRSRPSLSKLAGGRAARSWQGDEQPATEQLADGTTDDLARRIPEKEADRASELDPAQVLEDVAAESLQQCDQALFGGFNGLWVVAV